MSYLLWSEAFAVGGAHFDAFCLGAESISGEFHRDSGKNADVSVASALQ